MAYYYDHDLLTWIRQVELRWYFGLVATMWPLKGTQVMEHFYEFWRKDSCWMLLV